MSSRSDALTFTPVAIGKISSTLGSLFEVKDGGETITRASGTNMLVVGVDSRERESLSEIALALAKAHPARLFILVSAPESADIQVETSVFCSPTVSSSVCSELIRISAPEKLKGAVPSIVRANTLPGLGEEIYVHHWDEDEQMVKDLLSKADQIYFDSREMKRAESFLHLAKGVSGTKIDFNWVRLGVWREAVKEMFGRSSIAALLPYIQRIQVKASGSLSGRFDPSLVLMAGWLLDRLDLEPVAYGKAGVECVSVRPQGHSRGAVFLNTEAVAGNYPPRIDQIELEFKDPVTSSAAHVTVVRKDYLESSVDWGAPFTARRSIEPEDTVSLIERFFLVGESIMNYPQALKLGLDMHNLRSGFDL